jgi:hypothetical protein
MDSVSALLALDYYHGCRHERGKHDTARVTVLEKLQTSERNSSVRQPASTTSHNTSIRRRQTSNTPLPSEPSTSSIYSSPLPTKPPHTYHPLHSLKLGLGRKFVLQTLYDIFVISLLTTHTVVFLTSMPSNLRACKDHSQVMAIDTDPLHTNLSIEDRCYRINIDIHVAGGFAIALCLVLLGLHVWHVGYRVNECIVQLSRMKPSYRDVDGGAEAGEGGDEEKARHALGCSLPNEQFVLYTTPRDARAFSSSVDEEGRMGLDMGIRYRDWRGEKGDSETGGGRLEREGSWWSEVLLECLVP